ncbi:MAG: alpha/beta fold hydrolase [Nostoc sp. CreGUA01]|nr:alpha/beta hydrolase [Nostoc sp. CreGUA01]
MEEYYTTINGYKYHVLDSRNGHESVILLHGWPDESSLWRFQIPALVEFGYRVICFDWLGHGQSEKTEELNKYTLTSLSADVIGLMDALNVKKAHCIAHDYGAIVGWEMATRYPERLISYIALSAGHPLALIKNLSFESMIKSWYLVFNPLPVAIPIYRANNGFFFRWVLRGHPDKESIVEKFLHEDNSFYIQVWEKANPVLPFIVSSLGRNQSQLNLIKVPTLGIWSSGDNFMAEEQMSKSGVLVQAEWQYIRINKCNHWLQLENPDEINQHLLEWLNKHSKSKS